MRPRDMIEAIEYLEACPDVPSDVLAGVQSVPLSEMDAGQADALVRVARVYGWQGGAA